MKDDKAKIALLIDADNAPASKIDEILSELSNHGVVHLRRAYGNWKKNELKGWEERLHQFAIRPIQQFDYSKRKNASDMAITIDAVELLFTDRPDAYAIVSSDADFTPLVMRLRDKGAMVYGFGERHTPEPFVNACSRFLYLDWPGTELPDPEVPLVGDGPALDEPVVMPRIPEVQIRQDAKLISLLRGSVIACEDADGWATVGQVGKHMADKTSFDLRNYGYATLTKLIRATEAFEFRDVGTPKVAVRDRRHFLVLSDLHRME